MTYRELLKLYKEGQLDEETKKKIAADIERQDAISEYLYEEGEIPGLEDLEPEKTDVFSGTDKEQKIENERFIKEIRKAVRRALLKTGIAVGCVILAVILGAVFIFPKVVSALFYDPNEVVGENSENTDIKTTRMSLDLSVYSELFLAGNRRDQVNAVDRGYGVYDITIPQTVSRNGKFTSVSGKLVRGKLTLYDNNVLKVPGWRFYIPGDEEAWEAWEVNSDGTETKIDGKERKKDSIRASKEEIEQYSDTDWYTAYVSLDKLTDYKEFIQWAEAFSKKENMDLGDLWCAVYTDTYTNVNTGFVPEPSGSSMNWDREKYPYLSLLDDHDPYEMIDETDEKVMETHYISLLSYLADHSDIIKMMDVTEDFADGCQNMITYVKKNGLKIQGFAASVQKETLLELYEEDLVDYIDTQPQS